MRPTVSFIISLFRFFSLENCFPDASIPEKVYNANLLDSPLSELKQGQPKDIHICKNTTLHGHCFWFDHRLASALLRSLKLAFRFVTRRQCLPLLGKLTAGHVQSWEVSMVVLCEEWCYSLSLYSLKKNPVDPRRGRAFFFCFFLVNRLIGIISAGNT